MARLGGSRHGTARLVSAGVARQVRRGWSGHGDSGPVMAWRGSARPAGEGTSHINLGAWLSLVERCAGGAEVACSNHAAPTSFRLRHGEQNPQRVQLDVEMLRGSEATPTLISFFLFHGGRSSVGRAPDCGSGGRGFVSRRSPQFYRGRGGIGIRAGLRGRWSKDRASSNLAGRTNLRFVDRFPKL